ncbi:MULTISPECIES: hypothetical protein [Agrobacterium]|nr:MULTISPECIES: hypothetical protein [Agrobacterium]
MLLVTAHDIKARFLGALICGDRQLLGKIVEVKVILYRRPLLRSASGR